MPPNNLFEPDAPDALCASRRLRRRAAQQERYAATEVT